MIWSALAARCARGFKLMKKVPLLKVEEPAV